eukprot:s8_g40.t1
MNRAFLTPETHRLLQSGGNPIDLVADGDGYNLISLATAATALTPQQGLTPLLPRLTSCAMDIMDCLAGAGHARKTLKNKTTGTIAAGGFGAWSFNGNIAGTAPPGTGLAAYSSCCARRKTSFPK